MIFGLAGLFLFGIIFGILAIIFGSIALQGMNETGNEEGKGCAVAGVILGLVDIVICIIVIIALC